MAHFLSNRATDAAVNTLANDHSSAGAPVWELVKVTAASITEVVILSSVGYVLARRGIIDKKTQTKINKMNVSFFTPALLFSKVAFSLNPHRLAELFIVPIGFVLVTFVSTAAAWLLSGVTRLSKAQRNFAIACAISPNSNSLPVALMQALVMEVPQLHWDEEGEPEDTVDGMLGRALTYLVLFSTLGMFLRWSVGASLLSTVEDDEESIEQDRQIASGTVPQEVPTGRIVHLDGPEDAEDNAASNGIPSIQVQQPSNDGGMRAPPEPLTDGGDPPIPRSPPGSARSGPPAWARSFPNSPQASRPGSVYRDDEDADGDLQPLRLPPPSGWTKFRRFTSALFYKVIVVPAKTINSFMTAPLWAATASLVVAMIQPLQRLLGAVSPLVGALQTAGACSIPLTMVVLGAYFIEEKSAVSEMNKADERARQPEGAPRATPTIEPEQPAAAHRPIDKSGSPAYPWMKHSGQRRGSGEGATVESAVTTDDEDAGGASSQPPAHERQMWPMSRLRLSSADRRRRAANMSPTEKLKAHKATMERRTIFVAVVSRMLITPLVLIPAIAWYAIATHSNVVDDPVFITSACLIVGSPPALTLAQITSQKATGNSGFERLISRTIFVSYAIFAAPTTIVLVLAALLIAQND